MNADNKLSRRDFIRASAVTGGALLASTAIPGQAMSLLQEQKSASGFASDDLLKGVCDIHLHCRPDSRERSVDEYGLVRDATAAGYRAVMFKSNDFSCHDRAYIIRQALPGAECFGSFCMNRVHGHRVNPFAARKAVETSGGLCRYLDADTGCSLSVPERRTQGEGHPRTGREREGAARSGEGYGDMRRRGHCLCNRTFFSGRKHCPCQQGARNWRAAYRCHSCQFVNLDDDARPDQEMYRPWCIYRVLLSALSLGRGDKDAPIPTAKHRRICFICPHRPVTEFHIHRLGAGRDAAPR